ncbi:MAG: DNA photolyase family protein [Crocinitomicaceae bacterium]|nr:DNA photolyase family protein [Crocinitomicaceae bacterium]
MQCSIFWFRRDLRLSDNTGLNLALNSGEKILPIFIFDSEILDELPIDDPRVNFIYDSLSELNLKLKDVGSSIKCEIGSPLDVWNRLISEFDIKSVYTNKDYEPYALKRDSKVQVLLEKNNIQFIQTKDQVIFEEHEIVKNDGLPYTVFTPYKNKWLAHFHQHDFTPSKQVNLEQLIQIDNQFPSLQNIGFKQSKIKVKPYTYNYIANYEEQRDYPHLDATSYLSPHLRFGTISVREAIELNTSKNTTFLSELIWREFFMQILYHFPRVINSNFKKKYDGIKWRNDKDEFDKWCSGETGYPIVDAGMRQLNETGYMHNRVRMITAGFLCKHLLIDWKWGEAYFAKKLLDYDLSANNGNWQWASGTGCDSAPYFRIFNPTEQIKKFDKQLGYINLWVKDLQELTYPKPMVDHKYARERALTTYKNGLK